MPPVTAVTNPVVDTVAILLLDEIQGLVALAVTEPVSCEVNPTQALKVPVTVGNALTVKVAGLEV